MPPFHALPLEYPPLSLVIFSLAVFAPLHYYTVVFAILIALTIVFIYWLLLRYAPRGAALAFAIYMLIVAWGIAVGRFDLLPAAPTLLCVIAADRPVQIESTGSPILFLAANFGYPVQIVFSFGSSNVVSGLERLVEFFLDVLFVAGYLYALFVQWRGKLDVTQAFIAILLVFIVTGKVFSPQYLMWLIPLLAYSGAYKRFWLIVWVPISLLTTYIFPYIYTIPLSLPVPYKPGFI